MLCREEFIRLSLELNLFFARIAKEHAIFLAGAFTIKDHALAAEAVAFKEQFEQLLIETLALTDGVISPEVVKSNELVTPFTLEAEKATEFLSGLPINTAITKAEIMLGGCDTVVSVVQLEEKVFMLNQKAIALTSELAQFKSKLLKDVLCCKLFTHNYPLLLDHILREAKFYLEMLTRLQNRQSLDTLWDLLEQEVFWNNIMAEHSKFIRGLLDPTEEQLIITADNFGDQFDALTKQAVKVTDHVMSLQNLTNASLQATKELSEFKATATQGLITCDIRSIALPLLGDHVLREANHFIRILKQFECGKKR